MCSATGRHSDHKEESPAPHGNKTKGRNTRKTLKRHPRDICPRPDLRRKHLPLRVTHLAPHDAVPSPPSEDRHCGSRKPILRLYDANPSPARSPPPTPMTPILRPSSLDPRAQIDLTPIPRPLTCLRPVAPGKTNSQHKTVPRNPPTWTLEHRPHNANWQARAWIASLTVTVTQVST